MVHAPCGCALEAKARREVDPAARRVFESGAEAAKRAWRCPYAGCEEGPLEQPQVEALGAIERMTGWSGPPTCPRAVLSTAPLTAALRLLPAAEHGTLPMLTDLPAVTHEAVHAAAQGKGERWEYEEKIREQARKKASSGG